MFRVSGDLRRAFAIELVEHPELRDLADEALEAGVGDALGGLRAEQAIEIDGISDDYVTGDVATAFVVDIDRGDFATLPRESQIKVVADAIGASRIGREEAIEIEAVEPI